MQLSKIFGWSRSQTTASAGKCDASTTPAGPRELSVDELRQVAGGIGIDGTHNLNTSSPSLLPVDGTHN